MKCKKNAMNVRALLSSACVDLCVCVHSRMDLTASHRWYVSKCRSDHKPILYCSGKLKRLPYRRIHKMLYELCVCLCVRTLNKLTWCSRPDLAAVNSFSSWAVQFVPSFIPYNFHRVKQKLHGPIRIYRFICMEPLNFCFLAHSFECTHTHTFHSVVTRVTLSRLNM